MRKLYWSGVALIALVVGGLIFGLSLSETSVSRKFLEHGDFELFEKENVRIYVSRFDEKIPRFTGELVEGHLFVEIRKYAGLQLEAVSTGCGCSIVRPVEGEQNTPRNKPLEMAFTINTIGRVGPQDFPFTFRFRDSNGELKEYQARVQFLLERGIEIPPVTDAVMLEKNSKSFSRTLEIRSKIPDIQWEYVNVIVTGGKANILMKPQGKTDGVSVAELTLSGQVSDLSSSGGLTIVFESSQFKEQPRTVIPFIKPGEQFVWKPESLEFRDPQALPKLLVRANFNCSVDELSLEIDNDQLAYQIKKVGKFFVIDFQWSEATTPSNAKQATGTIRLLRNDTVAAEIPYQWSGT